MTITDPTTLPEAMADILLDRASRADAPRGRSDPREPSATFATMARGRASTTGQVDPPKVTAMRTLVLQTVVVLVVTSLVLAGCAAGAGATANNLSPEAEDGAPTGIAAPPSGASPSPNPAPDALIAESIDFRTLRGLRADESWVRSVAADARSTMTFGVPLLPEEEGELEARPRAFSDLAPLLQDYAARYPGEFGGMYVDPPGGDRVVVMFTDRLAEHEAALAKLVHPAAWLQLRETPVAERDLDALMERIARDADALRSAGIFVVEMSRDDVARTVDLRVSTERPDAAGLLIGLYGLSVTAAVIDPTGAYLKPRATLVGRTVDAAGRGVPAVVGLQPLFARELPLDAIGFEPNPDGTFRFDDQLPGRWLVTAEGESGQPVSVETELLPGAVTTLEIVVGS